MGYFRNAASEEGHLRAGHGRDRLAPAMLRPVPTTLRAGSGSLDSFPGFISGAPALVTPPREAAAG